MSNRHIDTALVLFVMAVLIVAAGIVGTELQRLRLENEHLAAELAIKTEALTHANTIIMELEEQ